MIRSYILLALAFVLLALLSRWLLTREGMADVAIFGRAPVDHERYVAKTCNLSKDRALSVYRNAMHKGEWEWEWMNNQRPEHRYRDPYYPKPQNNPMDLMAVPEQGGIAYGGFDQGDAPKTGFDGWTRIFGNTAIQPAQEAPGSLYLGEPVPCSA